MVHPPVGPRLLQHLQGLRVVLNFKNDQDPTAESQPSQTCYAKHREGMDLLGWPCSGHRNDDPSELSFLLSRTQPFLGLRRAHVCFLKDPEYQSFPVTLFPTCFIPASVLSSFTTVNLKGMIRSLFSAIDPKVHHPREVTVNEFQGNFCDLLSVEQKRV